MGSVAQVRAVPSGLALASIGLQGVAHPMGAHQAHGLGGQAQSLPRGQALGAARL